MVIGIDWEILAEAVDFYHQHGYRRIDVPWMVDYTTVRATFSAKDSRIFEVVTSAVNVNGINGHSVHKIPKCH